MYMVEKDYVIPPDTKIKQKALFNLTEMYMMMYYWFDRHGYDLNEKEYIDKTTASGKEIHIKWISERKVTDYIKFVVEIGFFVYGLNEVEVEEGNRKFKMDRGDLEMRFRAYILKDYEGRWEKPFLKFLREVYDKYIFGSKLELYEGDLYEETYLLMDEVKAFLNLHRFT